VTFTLDIRHKIDEKLSQIEKECRSRFQEIAANESEKGCSLEWKELVDSPAVKFHEDCIAAVRDSAIEVCEDQPKSASDGQLWKPMISGAGKLLSFCGICALHSQLSQDMMHATQIDGVLLR